MAKTISATEAKSHFGSIVESIKNGKGSVIVENRGEPLVAIVSFSDYEDYQKQLREDRRKQAVVTLRRLRAEVQEQNPDLTDERAAELAARASSDLVDAIEEKLKSTAKV